MILCLYSVITSSGLRPHLHPICRKWNYSLYY